ncbi:uncharacterized protein [Amphiura filiformis]|uniref:uncharacterized protein n=1 Tax=Amphiura filiformis TaxID=82378 RepID=UPI003B20BE50
MASMERIEKAALRVGLHMNTKKTKCMVFNQQTEVDVRTADGTSLEVVKDFKYLGAWIKSCEQDIKTRKALAWRACNKLTKIWKSHLPRQIKVKLFQATVESILLYGSETWTVTTKIRKLLDGCYTRLLRSALENLGFTANFRRSRRVGPLCVTDLDFADDIALISDTASQAQELLERIEKAALRVGLHMNTKKTKCMVFNQQTEVDVRTADGTSLEVVKDFKYLGAWIKSSEQDIKTRKALTWRACNKFTKIWKSHLPRQIKFKLFQATIESILLYGSETWTVTTKIRVLQGYFISPYYGVACELVSVGGCRIPSVAPDVLMKPPS